MLDVMAKSNLYDCLYSMYEELFTFGTAAMLLLDDYNDVIRGRMFTAGEYYLSMDADCRVNGFARQYWMTVGQMVKEFDLESISPSARQKYTNHQLESWVRVSHLIEENDTRVPEYNDFKNMPYRSLQWEDGTKDRHLRLGGFEEFPVIVSRWGTTTTSDIRGRGPGWDVVGDVKGLQQLVRNKYIALDKITNPPMQADSTVGTVNTLPGGVTRYSAMTPNAGVKPTYQIQIDLKHLEVAIEKTKAQISRGLYSDLFKMLIEVERGNITATEIAERQAERLNLLFSVVNKVNNEQNNPMVNRIYMMMNRVNLLPPPPKEIQGMPMHAQYISTLAQAQKMLGIGAVAQVIGFIDSQLPVDSSASDILNRDTANREYSEMTGAPAKILNSPEQAAAIRAEKRKQAELAQKQQQLMMAAEAAAKGGKAVKDMAGAQMDTGNALDKFMAANVPQGQ
jgi:hypothetical protein